MNPIAKPMLSHFGLYVRDLEGMVAFYTALFSLRVTDRGDSPVFHNTLVFLSADPNCHHQLVLASGRPAGATFSTVMQLSFKVQAVQELRRIRTAAVELGASQMRGVNHGNSFSIYFAEGNTVESYLDTPFYVAQPHADPLDLELSDADLLHQTEVRCRTDSTFMLAEEWRRNLPRQTATPNPSLERTATGMARRSSQVHAPLRRATPAAAVQLKR
jgi:catechol 2,3-dioxygenase